MQDPWSYLREFTQARIAQGRVGCGLPTSVLLDFQLAHAAARDAVHEVWQMHHFAQQLNALGVETLCLQTAVAHRAEYLQRPDKGRTLHPDSRALLLARPSETLDVSLIFSNGLSATAMHQHGLGLFQALAKHYQATPLRLGPVCLVDNARVAVADEIGALFKTRLTVIILGERPGLSAADSLGAYLTFNPHAKNTDAERNCVSNIRPPEGLSYDLAAQKIVYLSQAALHLGLSGVALKEDMPLPVMTRDRLE
jgi:ethanolamine ammonia-lyase small subunit